MSVLSDFMDTSDAGKLDMFEEAHARMATAEARVKELETFVKKFLGNFKDCTLCEHADLQLCSRCESTGRQIASRGVLFFELPDEAEQLLKGKTS